MLHGHGDEISGWASTSIVSRRYRGGGRASPQAPADLVAHVGQQPATVLYRPLLLIPGPDRAISTALTSDRQPMQEAIRCIVNYDRTGTAPQAGKPTSGE